MVNLKYLNKIFDKDQRSITAVYIFALSSIAVIAIGFQLLKFTSHSEQLESIESIKLIEQQKHFAEKAASLILNIQITNQKNLNNLTRSLDKILLTLNNKNQALAEKLPSGICLNPKCLELREQDFSLEIDIKKINSKVIENKLVQVNQYTSQLKSLANQLDNRVNDTSKSIILLDILFLILLIFVLFIQATWGFKPAVKKLNEALSVRADFISRISHEIRNPMNSIMGMADILKSTRLTTEQKQYVNNLQRSSHVLLDMLNNLVDFSGLENQAISLKEAKFNIYKLVDKITDIISIQAHEKNLELIIDIDPAIPKLIYGDVVRLEQVIVNLMNNALKFTNKGYILLRILCVDSELNNESLKIRFEIEDSGIGIEKDQISKIFNSFVQEDSSIKRRFGGSGLGLAISKEIVNLMGSSITVKSEKNVGSNFSFTSTFKYDPKKTSVATHLIGEKLIYLTGSKNQNTLNPYLEKITDDYVVIHKIKNLEEEVRNTTKSVKVIVDDSLGIINIINAATILKRHINFSEIFALMRSNFSKENMELIRKNGYSNFLIKPFRAWHLNENQEQYQYLSEKISDDINFESLKGEIKGRKLSILAVDDSNDNLFLLKEILNSITDKIDFANNGLEACEQIEKKPYDLVFMDIQMPIMDGYTAIKKIRYTHRKIPIYAVTAHAGLVDEKKCRDAGFTGRLTKPINREKIYTTIQNTFGITVKPKEKLTLTPEDKMLRKLMPMYFEARMEDIETLKEALQKNDFITIKKLGHRMKGSAKSYGYENIGEMSESLEKAAESLSIEKCSEITHNIEMEINRAKQSFDHLPKLDSH